MAEIVPVVSESLEAQVRNLLPSQRGFGEDLQASNVILPVIDLTSAALGTTTPTMLQTAIAFGSQTAFSFNNSNGVIVNTPGFWRVLAQTGVESDGANPGNCLLTMSDGLSTKTVWELSISPTTDGGTASELLDIVVFLRSGDSLSGTAVNARSRLKGSVRQIADVNGTLVNPVGYTPQ